MTMSMQSLYWNTERHQQQQAIPAKYKLAGAIYPVFNFARLSVMWTAPLLVVPVMNKIGYGDLWIWAGLSAAVIIPLRKINGPVALALHQWGLSAPAARPQAPRPASRPRRASSSQPRTTPATSAPKAKPANATVRSDRGHTFSTTPASPASLRLAHQIVPTSLGEPPPTIQPEVREGPSILWGRAGADAKYGAPKVHYRDC